MFDKQIIKNIRRRCYNCLNAKNQHRLTSCHNVQLLLYLQARSASTIIMTASARAAREHELQHGAYTHEQLIQRILELEYPGVLADVNLMHHIDEHAVSNGGRKRHNSNDNLTAQKTEVNLNGDGSVDDDVKHQQNEINVSPKRCKHTLNENVSLITSASTSDDLSTPSSASSTSSTSSSSSSSPSSCVDAAAAPLTSAEDEPVRNEKVNHQKDSTPARHQHQQNRKKTRRPFDPTRYHQRYIALQIAYLGFDYFGSTVQNYELSRVPTIEGHLFRALLAIKLIESPDTCSFSRCGRTDRGVSAFGQVVALRVRSALKHNLHNNNSIDEVGMIWNDQALSTAATHNSKNDNTKPSKELDYCKLLNRLLPSDIRILAWKPVPLNFHARFSACNRTYKYTIFRDGVSLPALRRSLKALVTAGAADYRNFAKVDPMTTVSTERIVLEAYLDDDKLNEQPTNLKADIAAIDSTDGTESCNSVHTLTFTGSSFLYHQVRCMTEVALHAATYADHYNKSDSGDDLITQLLNVKQWSRKPVYEMASELPLVLWNCAFNNENVKHCRRNHVQLKMATSADAPTNSDAEIIEEDPLKHHVDDLDFTISPDDVNGVRNLESCYSSLHTLHRNLEMRALIARQMLDGIGEKLLTIRSAKGENCTADQLEDELRGWQLSTHEDRKSVRHTKPFHERSSAESLEQRVASLNANKQQVRDARLKMNAKFQNVVKVRLTR